jgi:hypothetical protein
VNYNRQSVRLVSMLPTDFNGTNIANPHDANYHSGQPQPTAT